MAQVLTKCLDCKIQGTQPTKGAELQWVPNTIGGIFITKI